MSTQVEREPEGKKNTGHVLLLTTALVVPSFLWMLLGWASFFLPLLIFIFIQKYGWRYLSVHLAVAVPAALLIGYLLQSLELTFFCIALLPSGYMFALSAQRKEPAWLAGAKGTLVLFLSFSVFFSVLLFNTEFTFFQALTESLNRGIDDALRQYSSNNLLSAENYQILEQTLFQVKTKGPLVLPAILGSMLILVSWATLTLGNVILPKFGTTQPWVEYRFWMLPDTLIWILIASAVLALLPGDTTRIVGINCLIVLSLVYSFQGLAILVFLLKKWSVPVFLRSVIYVMVLLQSFGTILLVLAGIADVWFDIRRLSPENKTDTNQTV